VLPVAAVTFANGGDNIAVYVPVFATAGTAARVPQLTSRLDTDWAVELQKRVNADRQARVQEPASPQVGALSSLVRVLVRLKI